MGEFFRQLLLPCTLFTKNKGTVSTSYCPHFLLFLKYFSSIINITYLRSGNFIFHRWKIALNSKILKVNMANWQDLIKTWCQSPHPTVHNLKYFQHKKYVFTIGRFYFSPTKSVPHSRFLKMKTPNWHYFQKHGVSLHVLPPTI